MKKKSVIFAVIAVVAVILIVSLFFVFKGKDGNKQQQGNNNSNVNIEHVGPSVSDENYEPNVIIEDNGVKVNVSENINKEVIEVENFVLSNISLKYVDGKTVFLADVTNNSGVDYDSGVEMTVTFYDNDGKKIHSVPVITSTLLNEKTSSINANTTIDCTSAYDISIEIKK